MRFPTVFRRRVGDVPEDAPAEERELRALGKDERPKGAPTKADNFHTSTLVNINGFPSQRVVVGLAGPDEALGRRVPLVLWLHENQTDAWFRVPGDREVEVGGFAYFDTPCLISHGKARSDDDSHNPGSLDVVVVPAEPTPGSEPSPLPAGTYAFVVGTDVSNPGR